MSNIVIPSVLLLWLINFSLVICTSRPIIGVLAQEFSVDDVLYKETKANSYIAASYVKAIESSGARVVPILINQDDFYYKWIMNSINGVVIPGGKAALKPGYPYYDASTIIYKLAKMMNDKGIYFPVYSVCLGFEAMLTIYNNHKLLQIRCDITHENYPLQFARKYSSSLLFSNIPQDVYLHLKYLPSTHNNHEWCTTLRNYTRTNLPKEWSITTMSTSSRGLKFIASIEHKKYPFIGTQFHPEKVSFEWGWGEELNVPHHAAALRANRHFYDVFVKLCKLNNNKFKTEHEEKAALIYNYKPVYPNIKPLFFAQIYVF
ncbi:gamma-glutamyl hydrolase-like [Planococcus citri]|uniref:gamma-glutamyl hydrolase-like n=1 Tax=Planococcus citri TaxID=170843 RepID=UPI0031F93FED